MLERSTGEPTYFAADVAYHEDKLERGFDRMINVLGADHHGYIARMKARDGGARAPTRTGSRSRSCSSCTSSRAASRASMSKRRGDFVTLDDLIAEIGVDATRWFMLSRSHDSTVDLDLELAAQAGRREPGLLRAVRPRADRLDPAQGATSGSRRRWRVEPPGSTLHPSERELISKLLALPGEVAEAAERRAPHRIAAYALELAQAFAAFYRDCPVRDAGSDALRSLRLGAGARDQGGHRPVARPAGGRGAGVDVITRS